MAELVLAAYVGCWGLFIGLVWVVDRAVRRISGRVAELRGEGRCARCEYHYGVGVEVPVCPECGHEVAAPLSAVAEPWIERAVSWAVVVVLLLGWLLESAALQALDVFGAWAPAAACLWAIGKSEREARVKGAERFVRRLWMGRVCFGVAIVLGLMWCQASYVPPRAGMIRDVPKVLPFVPALAAVVAVLACVLGSFWRGALGSGRES